MRYGFKTDKGFLSLFLPLFALLLAACSPASTSKPTAPAPATGGQQSEAQNAERTAATPFEVAKERGGKFIMTESGAFSSPNDPHLTITLSGRVYSLPVTNNLLKRNIFDKSLPIKGDLAKDWSVSKDGLSYTFQLQQGVKFQNVPPVNGREFTSEDAKYTIMRITADPSVVIDKWKPRFQRATDFGKIKSIETPDK